MTIERNAPGADSIGGATNNWTALPAGTNIPCAIYKRGIHGQKATADFSRRDLEGAFFIITDRDTGVLAEDRIKYVDPVRGTIYFSVVGGDPYDNPNIGGETVYEISAFLRRT